MGRYFEHLENGDISSIGGIFSLNLKGGNIEWENVYNFDGKYSCGLLDFDQLVTCGGRYGIDVFNLDQ